MGPTRGTLLAERPPREALLRSLVERTLSTRGRPLDMIGQAEAEEGLKATSTRRAHERV